MIPLRCLNKNGCALNITGFILIITGFLLSTTVIPDISPSLFWQPLTKRSWAGVVTLTSYMAEKIGIEEYFMDKFIKIHYQLEDKLFRWKGKPNKSALIIGHMGGTRQEGKRPKNWEFYPLHIGFSWPFKCFCFAGNCHVFEAYRGESYYSIQ